MAWSRRLRVLWAVAGLLAIAVPVALVMAWPHVQRYTGTLAPKQFYRPVSLPSTQMHLSVLGVAHNAGNSLDTATAAIRHGADMIEVDVVSARGELVAGRNQPVRWLADLLFRGPALADVWEGTTSADRLLLDLKQTDSTLLDDLVEFLVARPGSRQVTISSRDDAALRYLRERLPGVTLLFTLAWPHAVERLRSDPSLVRVVDGVSTFHGLVDANLVGWLHRRGLQVLAWTVNDGRRLDELLRLGVDGVTTDNLAILRVLGCSELRRGADAAARGRWGASCAGSNVPISGCGH